MIKKSILLALCLSMLVPMVNCRRRPSCERSCPTSGACNFPTFTSVVIIFQDGSRRTVSTGQNGCIAYTSRNCGDCGFVERIGSNFGFSLTANPGSIDLNAPPATCTISGPGGISAAYGMPMVEYFDEYGNLAGSVQASYVSPDGTWLQTSLPSLYNAWSGTYQVVVTNQGSDGFFIDRVGQAYVSGYGRDRYDSDGDGWYDDEDCAPYDPSRNYDCTYQGCNTESYPYNGPVMDCPVGVY